MDESVLNEVELSGEALKEMHKGLEIRNTVLQIGEFNFMANNNLYQVLISDGKDSSHKVCLNSKFTKNLKKDLKSKKIGPGMIIKVKDYTRTKNRTTVIISEFDTIESTNPIIGNPKFLQENFFVEISETLSFSSQPTVKKTAPKTKTLSSQPNIRNKRHLLAESEEPGKTPISKKTRSKIVVQ